MEYNYTVFYVTAEGKQRKVNCQQSSNIAIGIAKMQLERGAQQAVIEVVPVKKENE